MSQDLLPINFGVTELPRRVTWRPDQGWRTIRTFRGAKRHMYGIMGHEIKYSRFLTEVDLQEDPSPNGTLVLTYSTPADGQTETPTDYWELHGNDIHKSILEHPLYGGLSAEAQAMLRSEIAHAENSEPGVAYKPNFAGSVDAVLFTPDIVIILRQLYDLWVRDQRHYTDSQFVLRKTQTISSNYQLNLSMAGLNRIWLLGQIRSTEAIPVILLQSILNIPNRPIFLPGTSTDDTRWQFGWLKRSPTITQRANNHFEVVQEWWLETWPVMLYPIFT